ncbi:MAG: hypothetical protein HUJ56_01505 [Erysipelotrichaceae bacterium]|nr:hypothetical protein [Erysipelotrichaceae bacterium]
MSIIKMAPGGAVPPGASFHPIAISAGAETDFDDPFGTDKDTDSKTDITDKDLLKMMEKLDGLPNDMDELTLQLKKMYYAKSHDIFPNTTSISSQFLTALNAMKQANYSKKAYDKAYNIIEKNGGLNEIALDENGKLFCMNEEGDFKRMTVSEYKGSEGKYKALTNAELLQARAYFPKLTHADGIIDVVSHGIGMESVTKYLNTALSKLGTDTTKTTGYSETKDEEIIKGLEYLK